MMLDPDSRQLYTSALTPPPGYQLDVALGTTYSLDLIALLSIPLSLALQGLSDTSRLLEDPVAVLEALHQTAGRVTVFAQRGRVQVPAFGHRLLSQLETSLVEVRAPRGGTFHPKLWVLRYVAGDDVLIRLLVLSRNLTADRSWDLCLHLEGQPTGAYRVAQRPLGELVAALPQWAVRPPSEEVVKRATDLGNELRRTRFELPPGFDSLAFHTPGMAPRRWLPEANDRLVVVSPFCSAEALAALAASSREPLALISRPETLDALGTKGLAPFRQALVLAEDALSEDGEDTDDSQHERLHGIHAKAYLWKRGWDTHVVVGSANATSAALLRGINVEILAELSGKSSQVGAAEAILAEDGFGQLLVEHVPDEVQPTIDLVEAALEAARKALSEAELSLRCEPDGELWRLSLAGRVALDLTALEQVVAWPVTVPEEHAGVDARGLAAGQTLRWPALDMASLTRLIAFRVVACDRSCLFTLSLPAEGIPEDRDAAVFLAILVDRDGFIRYLLRLLAGLGGEEGTLHGDVGLVWPTRHPAAASEPALLELMVRALAHHPQTLAPLRRRIDWLRASERGRDLLPEGFLGLWERFEAVLEDTLDG